MLIALPSPEVQRGEPIDVSVTLQNTGAGHHVLTGSPFKIYRVAVDLLDDDGAPLVEAHTRDLGRVVEESPPWATLQDTRLAPGAELVMTPTFTISQKVKSASCTLRVRVLRVVGSDVSAPLLERRIPLSLL